MRIRPTLALKFSLAFLVLIFLITSLSLWITTTGIELGLLEADQRESTPIAQELAKQLTDHIAPTLNTDAVFALFVRFSNMNPRLIPYLINRNGEIIVSSVDKTFIKLNRFNPADISPLLNDNPKLPVQIADPKNPSKRKPFVASTIIPELTSPLLVLIIEPRLLGSKEPVVTSTRKSILLEALLSFIAAGLIGLLLSRILTKRLSALAEGVRTFKGQEQISIPLSSSSDEVGELSLAFTRMAETIRESIEKLKQRDALRRELIAGVSHDLRTPLAAIKGYVEKLLSNNPPEGIKDPLLVIERNSKVLQKLIDGLFELARLDEIVEKLDIHTFSMSELVSDVVAKFSTQALKKNLSLTFETPKSTCLMKGDPSLLERGLSNLIENAILYTPEHGRVTATIEEKNNKILISIADTGRGIDSSDLPNIFEKFFRGDKSREKDVAGTGLGLAVTKKIVEAHSGTIDVMSTVGKGTTFTVSLPATS